MLTVIRHLRPRKFLIPCVENGELVAVVEAWEA